MSKRWYLSFALAEPVDDDHMVQVRQLLLDTLAQAGFPARSTTAEWWLVQARREPVPEVPPAHPLGNGTAPRHGMAGPVRGRKIA